MKHFKEAGPKFRQALLLEPRHTGAAYMLSLSLYFSGAFAEAQHLFKQLLSPGAPLEKKQIEGLRELSAYARLECLRLNYWNGLKLQNSSKIERELKKRGWDSSALEAFHLFLINGLAPEWIKEQSLQIPSVNARITDRTNHVRILKGCTDADMAIGSHLEAVKDASYIFIPLSQIKMVEMGLLKRWIGAKIQYRDDSRETVQIPLLYINSMSDEARGVQEGLETVLRPIDGLSGWERVFGQKQYRSETNKIGLAEIASIEISLSAD